MDGDSIDLEVGDVFVNNHGDTFEVTEVSNGEVHFQEILYHYTEEVVGLLDEGQWQRKD